MRVDEWETDDLSHSSRDEEKPRLYPPTEPALSTRTNGKFSCLCIGNTSLDVNIVRYNVATAHVFLYMTTAALILLAATAESINRKAWNLPNVCFHVVYTVCYASFLYLYAVFKTPPNASYVTGVALYFIGYSLFLALFVLGWLEMAGSVTLRLYMAGSAAFLVGSACLIYGTWQKGCCCIWRNWSALLWGSVCFFIGSILFCIDSMVYQDLLQDETRFGLQVAGLASFNIGRIFFLVGSTSDECNVLFRPKSGRIVHDKS